MIHVDHYTPFKFKSCLFLKCILSILYGILKQKLEAKRYLEDCSRSVLFDDALQHVEHLEELLGKEALSLQSHYRRPSPPNMLTFAFLPSKLRWQLGH